MVGFLGAVGPILSGIAGIASAFGAGGSGGQTQQRLNLGALRRQAEKHGFNPLTVLRNAPSGFMTTHHPSLSGAQTLARAISAGIEGFMITGVQQATQQRERALLDAQLDLIHAQTNRIRSAPRLNVSGVPGSMAGGSRTAGSLTSPNNPALAGREQMPIEGPGRMPGFNPGVTAPQMAEHLPATIAPIAPGVTYTSDPGEPDMDTVERTIGEGGAMVETVRRTGRVFQQNPGYLTDSVDELTTGIGSEIDHNMDQWERAREHYERYGHPVPLSEMRERNRRYRTRPYDVRQPYGGLPAWQPLW